MIFALSKQSNILKEQNLTQDSGSRTNKTPWSEVQDTTKGGGAYIQNKRQGGHLGQGVKC